MKRIMNNLYVTLYTFELKKNKHQDNTNKVYSNNKENFIHFKNQIHLAFLKDPNFKNLNKLPELNTKEFFLVDYNHILHCIIIGTKILVPGWSLQIEKSLEFYINKKIYLPNQFQFSLKDYTYWSHNADIKPRRLRSLGGALRRIISLHKNIYYDVSYNKENKNIQFYTIFGNNKKLQATYLGVSQNKKIIVNQKSISIDTISCSKRENKKEKHRFNEKNEIVNLSDKTLCEINKETIFLNELSNENLAEIYKKVDDQINILVNHHRNDVIDFLCKKLYSIKQLDFKNSVLEN
jgi:hypothetical protein